MQHVDAMTLAIAVALVDEDGKDPDWVRMVIAAKGFGEVDIDAGRAWLAGNPKGCRCDWCRVRAGARQAMVARPAAVRPRVARQLDLFG